MQAKKSTVRRSGAGTTRQSITLPFAVADHVRKLAAARRLSANQVLVDLVEAGIESLNQEKVRFMALAEELSKSESPRRQSEIKKELARLTFGE